MVIWANQPNKVPRLSRYRAIVLLAQIYLPKIALSISEKYLPQRFAQSWISRVSRLPSPERLTNSPSG